MKFLLLPLVLGITASSAALAANFTWNSATAVNWTTPSAWSNGSAPSSTDSVVTPLQVGQAMLSTGTTTVANFTAANTSTLGAWSIATATGATSTFAITGTLSKSANGTLTFTSTNASSPLSLEIGSVSISAGTLNFGETAAAKSMAGVTVTGLTTISGGALNLNMVAGGTANFGAVNMTGGTWNIRNTTDASATTVRVQGLSGSGGVIRNAGSGGSSANQKGILLIETTGATTFSGTIMDNTSGNLNNVVVSIAGNGVQTFTGENTYSGGTTISAGSLLVNNTAGSGVGTGAVTVQASGTFGGNGIVTLGANNSVDVSGVLQIGSLASAETFDINTSGTGGLNLLSGSTIVMDIWSNSLNGADKLVTTGAVSIGSGAILSLINAGSVVFSLNNQFDLFDWGVAPSGSFSSLILPTLGSGLSWDTSALYSTGIITVVPEPSTWVLLGLGFGLVLLRARSRDKVA